MDEYPDSVLQLLNIQPEEIDDFSDKECARYALLLARATAIEKDVINRLIQGPFEDEYFRTLPANLQVISISVKDKICYVNFDSSFLTDALSIDGNLIVYSIVNSLTELPDVQRVQIMVDGDSNIVFRDISLSSPLERNLNY